MNTDYNIHKPFKSDQLFIKDEIRKIIFLNQNEYDNIGIKDPNYFYIIKDNNNVYKGEDILVKNNKLQGMTGKYFITLNENEEYVIYMDYITTDLRDHLIEIERFKEMAPAMKALKLYNRASSHNEKTISLYKLTNAFIAKDITLIDFIIGVISEFGYKDHVQLQELMNTINEAYRIDGSANRNQLNNFMKVREIDLCKSPNYLYRYFFSIYRLMESYKFFKYCHPTSTKISSMIKKIFIIFN